MSASLTVLNLCGDGRRYAIFLFSPSQPLFNPLLSPPPLHNLKLNLITRGLKKNRKRKRKRNRKTHRTCRRNSQLPLRPPLLPPKPLVLPLLLLPPLRLVLTQTLVEDLHRGLKKSTRTKYFFSFLKKIIKSFCT